ncbi:MAG: ABC transporter permease [Anaerolineae bacterium]|nr:ABC transporter permease [Anaerolineae bacterium]
MRDLFRAEWLKIAGNRWVAGCLVWIFPVGALAVILVAGVILLLSSTARQGFRQDEAALWTEQAIGVWSFPNNPVGRLILLGFTAVVFAGEYQWGTWKNIVPRNRRFSLVLVKFVALGVFVVLAFALMSVLWAAGRGVLVRIAGASYGPRITAEVIRDFAGDYALAASLAFTSTIIAAGYAALAGMLTRSILGGVIVGFAVTFAENLSIVVLLLIGWLLDIPKAVLAYRFTPGYNLLNVASWISDKTPSVVRPYESGTHAEIVLSDSLEFSVLVLAAWVVGLILLTGLLFRRQDITS